MTNSPNNAVPDLSVVVLCYRSGSDVIPLVERLHKILSLQKIAWEIILVANYFEGAGDSTPDVVRKLSERLQGIRIVTKVKKGMMGWDLRSGLEACRGKVLAIIDGNGQFPIEMIISCYFQIFDNSEVDFVQTYRINREDGFLRLILSRTYNLFVRVLFPNLKIIDINSKPKLIKRKLYEKLSLEDDGWFLDAEMVLKAHLLGVCFMQEPIRFYRLQMRQSFVKLSAVLEFIKKIIRFYIQRDIIRKQLSELKHKIENSKTTV